MTAAAGRGESVTDLPRPDGGPTVIALGGNAISPSDSAGTATEQTANIAATMRQVAGIVAAGRTRLVLTHGNGPQVGNVLLKNELARHVVPPVPLDWCVAQTQATIGFTIANTLVPALEAVGVDQPVVPVVSRVLVDLDDPGWREPTKPIGPWVTDSDDISRRQKEGQVFTPITERGCRRLVASPAPQECLDLRAIELLLDDGAIVVANGGGGIPVARDAHGQLRGVEAVIDKDRSAALLAIELDAADLIILTDVQAVAINHGTAQQAWLGRVNLATIRRHRDDGQFAAGSMEPKVDAAMSFVQRTGRPAVIAALPALAAAIEGSSGTRIVP